MTGMTEIIVNLIVILDVILAIPIMYEVYEIISLEVKDDFENFNFYLYPAILINLPLLFIE